MPEAKYPFALSSLRLSKGRTAIDLFVMVGIGAEARADDLDRTNWKTNMPAAMTASTTGKKNSRAGRPPTTPGTGAVFLLVRDLMFFLVSFPAKSLFLGGVIPTPH